MNFFIISTFLAVSIFFLAAADQASGFTVCDKDFQAQATQSMNWRRSDHKVPPLAWDLPSRDPQLEEYAQAWAEYGARRRVDPPLRSSLPTGYNVSGYFGALYPPYDGSPEDIVTGIEAEGGEYPFYCREPPDWDDLNQYWRFTMMLWRSSRRVAFGCSRNVETGVLYFSAYFSPPGNLVGQYAVNVLGFGGGGLCIDHGQADQNATVL